MPALRHRFGRFGPFPALAAETAVAGVFTVVGRLAVLVHASVFVLVTADGWSPAT
ncbi:hypothetical protein [Salinirubrum litoreum]|uniref:Uncharacterized protein n=1 Tax=Salinirubrum litoreum TaxID=1126234 RepID=A0ABD5RA25_9EURY|nr:hypothetical protein [Salinirubrum litoreum]